ncbi:CAP domain-containing protein [Enterococcus hirae]|uniref:CAP domain-containing protein n=1 Tax=Enterococcus TaxID=1350 RepID=UPI0027C05C1D|nr:CAP domain-containing protein [Enterococcus hirae]MDQ2183074.1 CAP domain-containing protein [Enterococcus hirae]
MKLLNPKTIIAIGTFATTLALAGSVDAASTNVMYRLYNPNNHEHFYTSSKKERDHLVKIKWGNYEGPAWEAPTSGGHLVYRLYNKGLRDHHYTASWKEVQWLTKNYGWTYEGPAWRSAEKNNKPIYRLFLPGVKSGSHHYTASWKEVQWLTKDYGWKYEGIGWYGADTSKPKVNKSALEALYTSVKGTKKGDYTDNTWNAFQTALNNANKVLNDSKVTQKQVDSAKNTLDSAYKGLKKKPAPTVNKTELQALYNQVKSTAKGDFTEESWKNFQTALSNTKKVLDDSKSSQTQVNNAKNSLDSAFKGLQHKPKPSEYAVTVRHMNRQTGTLLKEEHVSVKACTSYIAKARTDLTNFEAPQYQVNGNETQTQTINTNTTFTFYYDEVFLVEVKARPNKVSDTDPNIQELYNYSKSYPVVYGQSITIEAPTFTNFVLDPRESSSNTVTLNNVTSNQGINFAYTHQYNVTVNHINVDTNAVLSTETQTVYEGDSFSTSWKNMTDQNYFLCRNDDSSVTVDKNGQRIINKVDQNRTITFKYKNISLSDLNNYVRQKELAWLNSYRQQNGVTPMQFNDVVQKAADIRAKELQVSFSHYRPGGGTFQDLLESLGCYGAKGENINSFYLYVDEILSDTGAVNAMVMWKDSAVHNANLLYNNQSIVGLSHAYEVSSDGSLSSDNVFISANPIFK